MNYRDVLYFWFEELNDQRRWAKDPELDDRIRREFKALWESAARGELFSWRTSAEGRLAEIIVLDQFPRNMFRGDGRAFSTDNVALFAAQEMVQLRLDVSLPTERRHFAYMPYMHSESLEIHQQAWDLFVSVHADGFERAHRDIIERFGRYPHRNEALGRKSTPEEIEFVKNHAGF